MEEVQSMQVDPKPTKQIKRKWTMIEDDALVALMVELHNNGAHNVDIGFCSDYLYELERILSAKIANCGLKAKLHIELRIRTLKKDWSIVYDMVYGKATSSFGWDQVKKMVTTKKPVWEAYLMSHKDVDAFMNRSFPYLNELSTIYA